MISLLIYRIKNYSKDFFYITKSYNTFNKQNNEEYIWQKLKENLLHSLAVY